MKELLESNFYSFAKCGETHWEWETAADTIAA